MHDDAGYSVNPLKDTSFESFSNCSLVGQVNMWMGNRSKGGEQNTFMLCVYIQIYCGRETSFKRKDCSTSNSLIHTIVRLFNFKLIFCNEAAHTHLCLLEAVLMKMDAPEIF